MSEMSEAHKTDILQAAIVEFGRMGYAAASTNEIVRQAKVSKGLLFHYFTNKEKLYIACQTFILEQYAKYMVTNFKLETPDFFERIVYSLRKKMEFGIKNPSYLSLINHAWLLEGKDNPLQRNEAEAIVLQSVQVQGMQDFFEGVDTSRFRDGIDMAKVVYYTRLVMEAAWARFMHLHNNDAEAMVQNINQYFTAAEEIAELLKYGAYKPG